MIAILLLAAGASTRMRGPDKLLQKVGGETLLRRQAKAALATRAPVFVTLPEGATKRAAALAGLGVICIPAPGARDGMAASLRAGIAALGSDVAGAMVVLADMPDLTTDDFTNLIKAFQDDPEAGILRGAAQDGTPGHPVLFPARLFPDLMSLTGDQGARAMLAQNPVRLIPLPDRHALTDLDTPEDWAAWRRQNAF